MIKVFNSDDKTYETNGNVVLNPTYANIHKEDNGDYYLDLETSIEEDKIKHIEHEEGTTIETTGTTLTDVDTTKEHKFISLYGETQQYSTTGKNLFNKTDYSTISTSTNSSASNVSKTTNSISFTSSGSNNYSGIYITNKNIQNYIDNFNSDTNYYISLDVTTDKTCTFGSLQTTTDYQSLPVGKTRYSVYGKITSTINFYVRNAVSGGVNIKIENIMISTSSDTTYEPYTNGASPNPTYPQEIHNVSGDNTIEICGKNLFGFGITAIDKTSTYRPNSSQRLVLTAGDNINEVKFNYASGSYCTGYFEIANIDGTLNYTISFDVKEKTTQFTPVVAIDTTNSTTDKLVVMVSGGNGSTRVTTSDYFILNNIMVRLSSTSADYEAYTGQSQLISLGVENLFDKDNANIVNGWIASNNKMRIATGQSDRLLYIPCKPNTTYAISRSIITSAFRVATYDSTPMPTMTGTNTDYSISNYIAYNSGASITITTGASAKYLVVHYGNINNDTNINESLATIQIEKGSKANSYTPYGASYIELNKISTYQDYIYKSNNIWYLHKEIGKFILKRGYGTQQYENNTYIKMNRPNNAETGYTGDKVINGYCNVGQWKTGGHTWNSAITGLFIGASSTQWWIGMGSAKTSGEIDDFVANNNITVYYVLATPTNTEITDTTLLEQLNNFEKMRLYQGITNISITPNDLTPTLKLHYNYMTGGDVVINNNDYIKSNNIIVANTPTGEQAFRITDIEKRKHKIVLKAWHISYDTKNYVIQDSYVVDKTCNQAMDHLNNATDNTSPFTTTSDIATINSYRCVRRSLFEAFNVVLERWGGHFVRDNWNFKIMNSIGQDNGVVVRYAKNLKDIQVTYDWTNVVTKILPVGNDGLLLDEVFLYADIQYDIPYTKVVHFDQNINENDYRDEQGILDEDAYLEALKNDLRSQATLYLQENYLPQVNYSLNANLEKITDIGDTIQVKDERLGVDITTNLISYDYDCILEKYTNLEFGNFTKTISDLTSYINSQTSQIVDESVSTTRITLENELETATSQIWGVLGSSYVLNEGDKILIVDSLPKETATNVIMINSAGIGFSQTGINGTFSTALTIDGTFNTSNVNVINFTADLIKGGVLKLGSNLNQNGILEVYDEANNLIAVLNKDGLRMNAVNGAYVLINQQVGFAGYDKNDNPIYWVSEDEFHMKKSVVEEEITLVDKMRIIPITITDNGTITNDGIGFVSTL